MASKAISKELMDLDVAIRMSDSLDSIRSGWTKETHVSCYKAEFRREMAESFDAAQVLVKKFGTVRKAINYVERQIDQHR